MPIHINPVANHPSNNSKALASSRETVAKNGSNFKDSHLNTGEEKAYLVIERLNIREFHTQIIWISDR